MTTTNPKVLFRPAAEKKSFLRLAMVGVSGSGKTYTSLQLATHLAGKDGRIALVDSEHGSSAKYSDKFTFDMEELTNFHPQRYMDCIAAAVDAGYKVIVLDSLSHAWSGEGGLLEVVDTIAARSQSKNGFAAWKDATPIHHKLIDTILGSEIHIIATMRAKTEYVVERDEKTGKSAPRKIGLAPDQRAGLEYEFDIVCDMTLDGDLIPGKTRCDEISGKIYRRPSYMPFHEAVTSWAERNNGNPFATPAQFSLYETLRQELNSLTGELRSAAKPEATAAQMDHAIAIIQRLIADRKVLSPPVADPPKPAAPASAATSNPAVAEAEMRAAACRLMRAAKKLYGADWENKTALAFSKPPREMSISEINATAVAMEAMISREAEKAAPPVEPPVEPQPSQPSVWDDEDPDEETETATEPPQVEEPPAAAPPATGGADPLPAPNANTSLSKKQNNQIAALGNELFGEQMKIGVDTVISDMKLPRWSLLKHADATKLIERLLAIRGGLVPPPTLPDANGELPRTPPAPSQAPEITPAAPLPDDYDMNEDPFADE